MSTVVLTDEEFERQLYDSIYRDTIRVKEIKKALHKIYYLKNRQELLDYQKEYNVVNKERHNAKYKLDRARYVEEQRLKLERLHKKRINDKKYRESHREILRLRNKIYRLKKAKEKVEANA